MRPRERQGPHDGLPLRRPSRWGCSLSTVAALSTFYPEAKQIHDPLVRAEADPPPDRQDPDPRRLRLPPLEGAALRLPGQRASRYAGNFLSMMFKTTELRYKVNPVARAGAGRALHPARRPRAELLHLGHARRRARSHVDPYIAAAAAIGALYGPLHGGANEQVLRMLAEIGSPGQGAGLRQGGEGVRGRGEADGLRAPGLQELRPAGQDHQGDGGPGLRGHRAQPAARHRAGAREDRALATSTSSSASSTRTSTSTPGSSTRPWASRSTCSRCSSRSGACPAGSPSGRRWSRTRSRRSRGRARCTWARTSATSSRC